MFFLAMGAVSLASAFDLRSRRIPNAIPGGLLLCVLALTAAGHHPLGWGQAALGMLAATLIALPLFRLGWFGGGDTKLAIALGPALGLLPFLAFFISTSICGGALALRARRLGETEIAYAPAMLLGLLALLPLKWLQA
ncbi:prepilin peptidase [bacterium]|nr:prepilin peptidase [bacterium]